MFSGIIDYFFPPPTLEELQKQNKREIRRSIRFMDREIRKFQNQEKKDVKEIKLLFRKNQKEAGLIIAKNVVTLRKEISKLYKMKAHLKVVDTKLLMMNSTLKMSKCMKSTAYIMGKINSSSNDIVSTIQEFEKQSAKVELKQEFINDELDSFFEDQEDVNEENELANAVLDEINVELDEKVPKIPKHELEEKRKKKEEQEKKMMDDIESRLKKILED